MSTVPNPKDVQFNLMEDKENPFKFDFALFYYLDN